MVLKILFAVLFSVSAWANEPEGGQSILEWQLRLEGVIARKYRERISEKLTDGAFDIRADVILSLKSGETPSNPGAERVYDLIRKWGQEPDSVELAQFPQDLIEVGSVSVHVRLASSYGEEYRSAFSDWLMTAIRSDFGEIGLAAVDVLKRPPAIAPKKKKTNRTDLLESDPDTENVRLFGLVTGGLIVLFAGFWMFSSIAEKRARRKRLIGAPAGRGALVAPATNSLQLNEHYERANRRLAIAVSAVGDRFESALENWYDNEGLDGRKKLAAVLSLIVEPHENRARAPDAPMVFGWPVPIRVLRDKGVMTVAKTFSQFVPLETRVELIERACWDLLSKHASGAALAQLDLINGAEAAFAREAQRAPELPSADSETEWTKD